MATSGSDEIVWGQVLAGIVMGVGVLAVLLWGMDAAQDQRAADPERPTTTSSRSSMSLQQLVSRDHKKVESRLVDHWVPQLASKTTAGGAAGSLGAARILQNHQRLQKKYGALLLRSDDYVFKSNGYYVSVAPQRYATGKQALRWCRRAKLKPADCLAKFITHDRSVTTTVLH